MGTSLLRKSAAVQRRCAGPAAVRADDTTNQTLNKASDTLKGACPGRGEDQGSVPQTSVPFWYSVTLIQSA